MAVIGAWLEFQKVSQSCGEFVELTARNLGHEQQQAPRLFYDLKTLGSCRRKQVVQRV